MKVSSNGNAKSARGFRGRESKEQRIARVATWFKNPLNAVLIPLGAILAGMDGAITAAKKIADGGIVTIDSLDYQGKSLPVPDGGYKISLANLSSWACFVCKSAHGTAIGASAAGGLEEASERGLMKNQWYYRPSDRALFTISDTCYAEYCEVEHKKHFSAVLPTPAPAKK